MLFGKSVRVTMNDDGTAVAVPTNIVDALGPVRHYLQPPSPSGNAHQRRKARRKAARISDFMRKVRLAQAMMTIPELKLKVNRTQSSGFPFFRY